VPRPAVVPLGTAFCRTSLPFGLAREVRLTLGQVMGLSPLDIEVRFKVGNFQPFISSVTFKTFRVLSTLDLSMEPDDRSIKKQSRV